MMDIRDGAPAPHDCTKTRQWSPFSRPACRALLLHLRSKAAPGSARQAGRL